MNTGRMRTQITRLTRWHALAAIFLMMTAAALATAIRHAHSQSADKGDFRGVARTMPPGEPAGERPYEMVRAGRRPPHAPLIDFDSLKGWQITGKNGGRGEFMESQRQRIWESPVARLVYQGNSEESEVTVVPPEPIPIPEPYSAATLWVFGNNWGWEPDPKTPPVLLRILLRDKDGQALSLEMDRVRWKEWWLIHRVVPAEIRAKKPLSFAGIQIKGCGNSEERELYFEDLVFYEERTRPLSFEPRPKRPIEPFPGQPQGANTGAGRLPFPTREETILPENMTRDGKTGISQAGDNYLMQYRGSDATLEYLISPSEPFFRDVEVRLNGRRVATAWSEAGPDFGGKADRIDLLEFKESAVVVQGAWKVLLGSKSVEVRMAARLWQKSLVIDVLCRRRLRQRVVLRLDQGDLQSGVDSAPIPELRRPPPERADVPGQGCLLRLGLDGLVPLERLRALRRRQDRRRQGPTERRRALPAEDRRAAERTVRAGLRHLLAGLRGDAAHDPQSAGRTREGGRHAALAGKLGSGELPGGARTVKKLARPTGSRG